MSCKLSIQKSEKGLSLAVDGPKVLVVLKASLQGKSEYYTLALHKSRLIDYPSDMFKIGELSGVIFPCPPTLREDFVYTYHTGIDTGIYGLNHVDPGTFPLGLDQGTEKGKLKF